LHNDVSPLKISLQYPR